jgi:RNA polymerase sigma-70 factor, ECF subfamily
VTAAVCGFPWSFEQVYDEYKAPISAYVYRLVRDREQADDLVQDIFIKVFLALPKMGANLKLRPWLYRIATNTALDALRRRKRIVWLPWGALSFEPADVECADPQVLYGTAELVYAALGRMPWKYRAALLLYTRDGCSYRDIARFLNLKESGVKMYLTRSRKSFRQHFRDLEQSGEDACMGSIDGGSCDPGPCL